MRSRVTVALITALVAVTAVLALASTTLAAVTQPDAAGTVWLCRPGLTVNPCVTSLATSVQTDRGVNSIVTPTVASSGPQTKVDCFYVYPTVSQQMTTNSDLTIEPAQTAVATAQASRFSAACKVWAPMYRQQTLFARGLTGAAFTAANTTAYKSVLAGFKDYLAHFNKGRPIVFIGHSQGAGMLIQLLRNEIDPNPKLRKQLVSAVILGGNVAVKNGSDRGGSFKNIPACRSAKQTGCVIAYSSFIGIPPPDTNFGIPGQGESMLSKQTAKAGLHVLCVNPANFGAPVAPLMPLFNGSGTPLWTTYPGLYTGECQSTGGATVLHIEPSTNPGDLRPRVSETLGPAWGLHLFDVNIALGNLVKDVTGEVAAYLSAAKKAAKATPRLARSARAATITQPDAAGTTWLCRPGLPNNPCLTDLSTKLVNADGTTSVLAAPKLAANGPQTKFDCFYVYPTVSSQQTPNADLTIDPAQTSVAQNQAARFSAQCQVWAPMYRQVPLVGLAKVSTYAPGGPQSIAYNSVLAGFKDYLANYNHGRPIIFIGHSQGAAMLMELLHNEVDPSAKLRKQLISAVLAGGNVIVKNGSDRGGSFNNIPACAKPKQVGCVIAYSSFLNQPPANSNFGLPGQGVSFLSTQTTKDGVHVLCTNPAALGGGAGSLIPLFARDGTPKWNTTPGRYTAACSSQGAINVLHVTPAPGDSRPAVAESSPTYGLHVYDVNIALGNLVADVAVQEKAFRDAAKAAAKKKLAAAKKHKHKPTRHH